MRFKLSLLAMGLACLMARAVPADPTPFQVTQPDGSILTVVLHGDEFFNYMTTNDGYTLVKNQAGFYTYARLENNHLVAGNCVAHDADQRSAADYSALAGISKGLTSSAMRQSGKQMLKRRNDAVLGIGANGHMDYSKFRGLIILINYTDKTIEDYIPYTYTVSEFYNDMINLPGYTGYTMPSGTKREMTGSVRDFYYDNSNQMFDPHFDILGPVNVDFVATDANQMSNCAPIFFAAIDSLDNEVDFSQYDTDDDGTVDMVFFLVAGWGSDYSSNNRQYLWPHMYTFEESPTVDGVNFGLYACSTAMTGAEPQWGNGTIGGIGTFCHEFSHVLGLPDMYDTDYAGSGGQSRHPSNWSIMASGFKINNGYNPVGYSLYERYALGFAAPELITAPGTYSMQAVDESNTGYRLNTPNEGEYFLFENRQAGKWDKSLPAQGMLVFRVDSTNVDVWESNKINCDPNHMYYEMLRANYNGWSDSGRDVFPGTYEVTSINNVTSPSLRTWDGQLNRYGISDIAMADKVITFNVERDFTTSVIEDFETMPVGEDQNQQGVVGVYAAWNFSGCAVVDTAQLEADCGHVVAMLNGSVLTTADTLDFLPNVVRYTVYNPTSSSALYTVNYSLNGTKWTEPDNATISVPAGASAVGTVSLPTDAPLMLRIKQTSGSTTEPCYLDDIVLYYEGPEIPDFIPGDVNNDGLVNIKDITDLIDYVLAADVTINTDAADVNGDEAINIADVTALIDKVLGE